MAIEQLTNNLEAPNLVKKYLCGYYGYPLTLFSFHIWRSIGSHMLVYRWLSTGIYVHLLQLEHCAWNTTCITYGSFSVQYLKFLTIVFLQLWPNIGLYMDSIGYQWNTKNIFLNHPLEGPSKDICAQYEVSTTFGCSLRPNKPNVECSIGSRRSSSVSHRDGTRSTLLWKLRNAT